MKFWRECKDNDLDAEFRSHFDEAIRDRIERGESPEQARANALREFGNVGLVKEVARETWGWGWLEAFGQDLRFGLRMLRKNPGFSLVAILTLALGIGANTAIFSVVNAVLLRSLPYRDPDQLVIISHYRTTVEIDGTSVADFLEWGDRANAFEQIAAYASDTADLKGAGEPERLIAGKVSADLFATLGAAPALGRAFMPTEYADRSEPVVILSDRLWRRRFGGDRQVIGRVLTMEGQSRTVIGIMPPGFWFPEEFDVWLPLVLNSDGQRRSLVSVIARLRPGVTPEAARSDLSTVPGRQQNSRNGFPDGQIRVIGLGERLVGKLRLALSVLFGAVVFVLLIACANVANLLLARSAARQKEMAIRAAVGAGRQRLIRQILTESLLLSLAGGMAGLLAAKWGIKLLAALSPDGIARIQESNPSFFVNGRMLAFTCAVAALTGLITGIIPALHASKTDVNQVLKTQLGARCMQSGAQHTLPALMIAEIALALVLVIGAGLMINSYLRLLAVPKGFTPDGVLTLTLSPSLTRYPMGSTTRRAYFHDALDRVQKLPGVQSAGLVASLPLTGPTRRLIGVPIEGRPAYESGKEPVFDANFVSPDYFQTMGIQMRAGRPFSSQDSPEAPQVVIINETLARRFFPQENPIGRRLLWPVPKTIVGVAGDAYNRSLDGEVYPEIYVPSMQDPNFVRNLVVRAAINPNNSDGLAGLAGLSNLAAAIRNQLRAVDSDEPVNRVVTMDERLLDSVGAGRFQALLLGLFAAVALVIATVGIYGVISYGISRRRHEIGIRMALGAQRRDVLRMVMWQGMRLTFAGVALGLAAALALTRVLRNLLFEVSATDPATFALVALLLIGVAFLACCIPARRAMKVDPLVALRHD
jgi:putative ABC transport system permease protein